MPVVPIIAGAVMLVHPMTAPIVVPILESTARIVQAIAEPAGNILQYFIFKPASMVIAPVLRPPKRHGKVRHV